MAYNTGNPIGSKDPRDLSDNAENLDTAVNTTSDHTWTDRLGNTRKTWLAVEESAPIATAAADRADSAADRAEQEADRAATSAEIAAAAGRVYPTSADGVDPSTGVPAGQYYWVPSADDDETLELWQNVAGVATDTGKRTPSSAVVDELRATIRQDPGVPDIQTWADLDGYVGARIRADGAFESGAVQIGPEGSTNQRFSTSYNPDVDGFVVCDIDGYVGFDSSKTVTPPAPPDSEAVLINQRNAANLAAASALRDEINNVAAAVWDYIIILVYGQSLSSGWEGWPALSKIPRYPQECFMLGASVRGGIRSGATWAPLGGANLTPLAAVVQNLDGTGVLSDVDVAALAPGSFNDGESLDVGAINMWRKLHLQYRGLASDPAHKVISLNCGVGGQTVEALSKGASPELFNRIVTAVTAAKNWVDTNDPGKTIGIGAIIYMQGENNYANGTGGTQDKDTYKGLVKQLMSDIVSDVAVGILGQTETPAVILGQTNGVYTNDATNLSIGKAQIELCSENPGWYLASPSYTYTDKGGHLDPNGYRWFGNQIGKVLHRVLDRRQNWQPLKMRSATVQNTESGATVLVDMLVWHPPLKFADAYVTTTATTYAAKGFRCTDDLGEVPISSVTIAADTVLKLALGRQVSGQTYVWYASRAQDGSGNVVDSDPTIAADIYEYHAGTGQYPAANIAALVGKPYPLNNQCVADRIAAQLI